jgi:hydrogenase-4 component B
MTSPLTLILAALALIGLSGVPGLWLDRRRPTGQRLAAAAVVAGAGIGLCGAVAVLVRGTVSSLVLTAAGSGTTGLRLAVDGLSAFFLVPVFLLGALGAVYGLGYWRQARHLSNGRKLSLFWGVTVAGMGLLLLARHAFPFLLGWELMALGAFFLVSAEEQREDCRAAGWLYLIATHVGSLALFALFALLHRATGSFEIRALAASEASPGLLWAIYLLALLGFGLKAGLMPLHFWLPSAHANAPSHVSALMSGVLIKMGVYGLVRFLGLLPAPPLEWGAILLLAGAISGVLGILFAMGQHDLKRLLAYCSVENIGIIVMGLGLALLGRSLGRPAWVVLGLAGGLLHVWNHSLFKALLFFGAGSVVHATHTRQIDRLGGLAGRMPLTATLFGVGAVAICGLPPLNGFVSEFLIYLGLLGSVQGAPGVACAAAFLAPALALIGALALACFVKVYGVVFLGVARSGAAAHAHEPPLAMTVPMVVLAGGCALIGLAPFLVAPALDRAIAAWLPNAADSGSRVADLAALEAVSLLGVTLVGVIFLLWLLLRGRLRRGGVAAADTWGCGYLAPTPRIQYTASSFVQMLVELFRGVLRSQTQAPVLRDAFPAPASFSTHVADPVLDGQILPWSRWLERGFIRMRRIQGGVTQHYLLYMLATVIVLLALTMPWGRLLTRLHAP